MVAVFFSGYRPPFGLSWVNLRYMAQDLEIMKAAAGPTRMGAYESAAEMGELTLIDALARHTHVFDYFQMAEAESAVLRDLDSGSAVVGSAQASHAQPVVVVGHSLGGWAALGLCERLAQTDVCVDLLITLDPVRYDPLLTFDIPFIHHKQRIIDPRWAFGPSFCHGSVQVPHNVQKALNYFTQGYTLPEGIAQIEGAENVPVWGRSHRGIPDAAFHRIRHAIANFSQDPCNAKSSPASPGLEAPETGRAIRHAELAGITG